MRFRPIDKIDTLTVFEKLAGKHYIIDHQHLDKEEIFFALQIDLRTNRVSDKGLLVIKLKRAKR